MHSVGVGSAHALICILLACAVDGAPLFQRELTSDQTSSDHIACSVNGNPDFYGLGIRLGIYLQWSTLLLANYSLPEAIAANLETNTIFLLAIFVATIVATAQKSVQASEIVVILHLCFGFLSSILSIWGHRTITRKTKSTRFSLVGSSLRIALTTAICAYSVWFWVRGFEQTRSPTCSTYTFIFTKLDIQEAVQIYFRFTSIIATLVYGVLLAKEALMIISFFAWTCFLTLGFSIVFLVFGTEIPISRDPTEEGDRKSNNPSSQTPSSHPRRRSKSRQARGLSRTDSQRARNMRIGRQGFHAGLFVLREWIRLTAVVFWGRISGEDSAGSKRPNLSTWLYLFVNSVILICRTIFQLCYAFAFDVCPRVDLPPLVIHPCFENSSALWIRIQRQKLTKLFKKARSENLIISMNALCLIWAVLAVELSLSWNNVSGIYTIQSTGQLIPFIIGIVSFVRVILALLESQSRLRTTDELMKLLDKQPEQLPDAYDEPWTFPMNDGTEAIFYHNHDVRQSKSMVDLSYDKEHTRLLIEEFDLEMEYRFRHGSFRGFTTDCLNDARIFDRTRFYDNVRSDINRQLVRLKDDRIATFIIDFRKIPWPISNDMSPKSSDRSNDDANRDSSSQTTTKPPASRMPLIPSRLRRAFKAVRDKNTQHIKSFHKWSAKHPIHNFRGSLKPSNDDIESEAPPVDILNDALFRNHLTKYVNPNDQGLEQKKHLWPNRRKVPYRLEEAFKQRSIHLLAVRLGNAAIHQLRPRGLHLIATKFEAFVDMVNEAKQIRNKRQLKQISLYQQHETVKELWRSFSDWQLKRILKTTYRDAMQLIDQFGDDPYRASEAQNPSHVRPVVREDKVVDSARTRRLYVTAQIQYLAANGRCMSIDKDEWIQQQPWLVRDE